MTLTFRDAGHILGSASVWLQLEEDGARSRIVFSGDVGQYDSPILRDPDGDGTADVVVMESTYGNRRHRERSETLREFGEILRAARRGGGNVLIPAFAVGRSQEILYELATHFDEWRVGDWQVFLDSPMAIEASEIYWKHPELYDAEASAVRRDAGRMPALPNLKLCRSAEESMAINLLRGGAIIIAGSGMCNGGRIVHHLKHNLTHRECDVIFTGFQAVGTLGRAIVDGREHVRIHGEQFKVNARIHTLGGFSAHGDQEDLLRWHASVGGKPHTYLVHGEAEGAIGLCDALRARGVQAEVATARAAGRSRARRRALSLAASGRVPGHATVAGAGSAVDVEAHRHGRALRDRLAVDHARTEAPGRDGVARGAVEHAARFGRHHLDVADRAVRRDREFEFDPAAGAVAQRLRRIHRVAGHDAIRVAQRRRRRSTRLRVFQPRVPGPDDVPSGRSYPRSAAR